MIITYNILSAVHLMPRKVQIHSPAGSMVHFFNHYPYVKMWPQPYQYYQT